MKTVGYLHCRSSLFEIFPSGEVPLASLDVVKGQGDRPDCYLLDATKISGFHGEALTRRLIEKGLSEARAFDAVRFGLLLDVNHFCEAETYDPKQIALMFE